MRFEVSRVMDAIERRLTTDLTLAQAVVDLGEVARFADLDGGRPVNLLRIGMVVDALGRYLIDGGAMLYPVAARELLAESAFTSKERMVLGRWLDDGLIEVTPVVTDRVVEIADFTGLPLIAVTSYGRFGSRFGWLRDSPERVLRLVPRSGGAILIPGGRDVRSPSPGVVIGKAPVVAVAPVGAGVAAPDAAESDQAAAGEPAAAGADPDTGETRPGSTKRGGATTDEPAATGGAGATAGAAGQDGDGSSAGPAGGTDPGANGSRRLPDGVAAFLDRGALRVSSTRVVQRRLLRAEPSGLGTALLARYWRCPEPDCPSFGEYRRIGQPVPRMRNGVPACPRHGVPVVDVGPRPVAFAVAVVIEDFARRRFVVDDRRDVTVGRSPDNPDDIALNEWLHESSAAWIAPEHLRLQVRDNALKVIDASENGTRVWRRSGPDDPGEAIRLHRDSHRLGEWDSIELYTGVELVPGERRLTTIVANVEPSSVLVDAPTVATQRREPSR